MCQMFRAGRPGLLHKVYWPMNDSSGVSVVPIRDCSQEEINGQDRLLNYVGLKMSHRAGIFKQVSCFVGRSWVYFQPFPSCPGLTSEATELLPKLLTICWEAQTTSCMAFSGFETRRFT